MNECSAKIKLKFEGDEFPEIDLNRIKKELADHDEIDGFKMMSIGGEDEAVTVHSGKNSFILGKKMIIIEGSFEEEEIEGFIDTLDTVLDIFYDNIQQTLEYDGETVLTSHLEREMEDILPVFVEQKDTLSHINSFQFTKELKSQGTGVQIKRDDKRTEISIINGINFIAELGDDEIENEEEVFQIIEIVKDQIEKFKILNDEIEEEVG